MGRKILIGVQARSSSTRLPRKAFALIGGRTMLDRVLQSCKQAAEWLSRNQQIETQVAILSPEGDEIVEEFKRRYDFVEGPLEDVLTRYVLAAAKYLPDHIIRITGDCPMIQSYMITTLAKLAIQHEYDYVSNVDERYRTALDGADVEVISTRLLMHAHKEATDPADREHVTPFIRREPPEWAKIGFVCGMYDLSDIKLSVDTSEDLVRVRKAFDSAREKYHGAILEFGKERVHRL